MTAIAIGQQSQGPIVKFTDGILQGAGERSVKVAVICVDGNCGGIGIVPLNAPTDTVANVPDALEIVILPLTTGQF